MSNTAESAHECACAGRRNFGLLLRIRLVHKADLSGNGSPFELAPDWLFAPLLQMLLPLKELVGEAKVGLNDNIQPPCADEAA